MSHLEQLRIQQELPIPSVLEKLQSLTIQTEDTKANSQLESLFPRTLNQPKIHFSEGDDLPHNPLRVGLVLSGGQAAGGHNVIAGIFDGLKKLHPNSVLFGFLDGPSGIVSNSHIEITKELIDQYRNTGGFDLIGSGRTKIETPEQFAAAEETAKDLDLDGLVIIGGDDSNTNAALLAEYYLQKGIKTRVIGAPKTIDGDLKNEEIEISFGFDTATKTFSEIIGNILRDSLSAKKYYFFIKLMGRSASHIALECALQTHPNLTFIGEEVAKKNQTLQDLTNEIADMICARADQNKNYGVVLIPEGIIEFIPEFRVLIDELNRLDLSAFSSNDEKRSHAEKQLSVSSKSCFTSIPRRIQEQLLLDRDPHGNVQVSKIETERLFMQSVKEELDKRKKLGDYSGKFSVQPHFCGYEGRSCLPSHFDSNYCYAIGHVTALLIDQKATGYMACVQNLTENVKDWTIAGAPIASMIHLEERKGKMKPVIRKALVELEGLPFQKFNNQREGWKTEDDYVYPGPIQFFGPSKITDTITQTLHLEQQREQISSL